jgi:putative membrane protein
MLQELFFHTIIALVGLWASIRFVPGVDFYGSTTIFVFCGFVLGVLNTFAKPVLKIVALPLRIITLGLFNIAINMIIIWFLDVFFPELVINGLLPLFLTSVIIGLSAKLIYPK